MAKVYNIDIERVPTARGVSYKCEIKHDGLNKYRVIKGKDYKEIAKKAEVQLIEWDKKWEIIKNKESKKQLAENKTLEAKQLLDQIEHALFNGLQVSHRINWEEMKDFSDYNIPKPKKPAPIGLPREPLRSDPRYHITIGFIDKIITSKKENKIKEARALYKKDYEAWEANKDNIVQQNRQQKANYINTLERWNVKSGQFLQKQEKHNQKIEKYKIRYLDQSLKAIIEYCEMVFTNPTSHLPLYKECRIDYNPETKILLIDYSLPSLEEMPTLKEVKYIQTRDELKESHLSVAAVNKMYDSCLYQITLRAIYQMFNADVVNALDAVVFNGWVTYIDKGTGQDVTACILSLLTNKEEFLSINLQNVDPKQCFKNLKGVGSSKLYALSPIAPIMTIDKEDVRFVSSIDVADTLDESMNLAAMDWEEFEHLVRELFEKEFSQGGGEVKITRASRDWGVDAIAFDPDPIRGGKIVIQAKRYTNTVGVSAVRDLYGTLVNEGATKGILVTTSDYGPESYDFAKGKPITLLNGGNLLHLLEKHGHKAKIDLKEAKKILAEREKETRNI
jgi:restriction system protein